MTKHARASDKWSDIFLSDKGALTVKRLYSLYKMDIDNYPLLVKMAKLAAFSKIEYFIYVCLTPTE